jgi:5'-nucleotidase
MSSGTKFSRRAFFRQTLAAGGVTLFAYANGSYRMTFANAGAADYTLRVVHTNDHHGRIDPEQNVTIRATPAPAITRNLGGVARRKTLIDGKKADALSKSQEFLLVDAGDVFQGTLYFNQFQGQADLRFYNLLGYDAMAIGNHEFDSGQQTLVDFIKGANFPIISANVEATPASILGALAADVADPAADKWGKRVILTKGTRKIGLFGLTPTDTGILSSPGAGVTFGQDLAAIAQAQINALKSEGANIVIGLTHIGYSVDVALVPQLSGLSLIVGGHSHTPLRQTGDTTPAGATAAANYPTLVNDKDGKPVPVVTDWEWGKWLGDLVLEFDASNNVTAIASPGAPQPVWADGLGSTPRPLIPGEGADVGADPAIEAIIAADYRPAVVALGAKVIGQTAVLLNGARAVVRNFETNLGNLIADALIERTKASGTTLAITNGGGIRASINGPVAPATTDPVTVGEVLTVLPFGNTIALVTLTGAQVIAALENGLSQVNLTTPSDSAGRFPQVGGLRFSWDPRRPAGSRVIWVWVKAPPPTTGALATEADAWVPINLTATYRVATNNFMLTGGDGYSVFTQGTGRVDTGLVMADEVQTYIAANSPVNRANEGRILRVQSYYPFVSRDAAMTPNLATVAAR